MHALHLKILFFIGFSVPVIAQQPGKLFFWGVDVAKTPLNATFGLKGITIEPVIKFSVSESQLLNITGGYAKFRKDTVFKNQHFSSEGFYLKVLLETIILPPEPKNLGFSMGYGVVLTEFNDYSYWVFKGNYFKDELVSAGGKNRFAAGLEVTSNFIIPFSEKVFLNLQPRLDLILLNTNRKGNDPEYFVSGFGFLVGHYFSGGGSAQLLFKIR